MVYLKKLFFSILLLFVGLNIQAQDSIEILNWMSFEEMQIIQKKEPKKVLIDVYADWCVWCKKIEETSLNQIEIANYLSKNYYLVKFKPEDDKQIFFKGEEYLQKKYKYANSDKSRKINSLAIELMSIDYVYPSFIFLDESLNKLTVFDGYKTAKELDPLINYFASNSYLKIKWSAYLKDYDSKIK